MSEMRGPQPLFARDEETRIWILQSQIGSKNAQSRSSLYQGCDVLFLLSWRRSVQRKGCMHTCFPSLNRLHARQPTYHLFLAKIPLFLGFRSQLDLPSDQNGYVIPLLQRLAESDRLELQRLVRWIVTSAPATTCARSLKQQLSRGAAHVPVLIGSNRIRIYQHVKDTLTVRAAFDTQVTRRGAGLPSRPETVAWSFDTRSSLILTLQRIPAWPNLSQVSL